MILHELNRTDLGTNTTPILNKLFIQFDKITLCELTNKQTKHTPMLIRV